MITIKEVAKEAGVSITTVSRVMNNRGYISAETRGKVEGAMKKLNYQPNQLARSFHSKKNFLYWPFDSGCYDSIFYGDDRAN